MTYEEIVEGYSRYASKLEGVSDTLPYDLRAGYDGEQYLEFGTDGKVFILAKSRGRETYRYETSCLDDLLYVTFKAQCKGLGLKYELEHRDDSKDWRRIGFPYAIQQMGKLSLQWQKRMEKEISELLARSPYQDRDR